MSNMCVCVYVSILKIIKRGLVAPHNQDTHTYTYTERPRGQGRSQWKSNEANSTQLTISLN